MLRRVYQLFFSVVFISVITILFFGFHREIALASSVSFDVGVTVEGCNSNLVCELGLGETVATCPSDCTVFQCSNGLDDDGDGSVDYPDDPHCDSALDDREQEEGGGNGGGGGNSGTAVCSLFINPSTIALGETANLTWSSSEAGLQKIISPDIGSVSAAGAVVVSPSVDTTYTGLFTGLRNTAVCTATLSVETPTSTPGFVSLGSESYVVYENAGFVTVGLHRTGGSQGEISIEISTVVASADGRDFEIKTEVFTWTDGNTDTKTFTVAIFPDIFEENDEVFSIFLRAIEGEVGGPAEAIVTIKDVFTEPDSTTLTLIKQVINDDEGALGAGDFILMVDGEQVQSGTTLVVDPESPLVINEIPHSGYQFVSVTGSSVCPNNLPGEIILEEGQDVVCTITNNDIPPESERVPGVVSFTTNTVLVEEGSTVTITLSRYSGNSGEARVLVTSSDGTAVVGNDYEFLEEAFVWGDGQDGQKTFVFRSWEDNLVEGDESLSLTIFSDSIPLANPRTLTIIIKDNDSPEPDCVGAECFVITPDLGGPPEVAENVYVPVVDRLQTLKKIYDIPLVKSTSQVVSGAGVLLGAGSLLTIGFGLQNLWLSFLRLLSLLFSVIGLRRKARPWGTVYDSVTKQPLDPAVVYLYDKNKKEVGNVITDIDGRYGFLVKPGTYTLVAKKTHYKFPSKRLESKTKDELYDHLYFGESLEIEKDGDVIAYNIPMDPEKFDWNEFAKRDMRVMKFYRRRDRWLAQLGQVIFLGGFIFAFFAFLYVPHPYNFVIFVLYVGMLFLTLLGIRRRKSGVVTEAATGKPLSFAVIRIIAPVSGQEVGHVVTDAAGRYFKLIIDGTYTIRIEKKISEEGFELVFEQKEVSIKQGILNKNFEI